MGARCTCTAGICRCNVCCGGERWLPDIGRGRGVERHAFGRVAAYVKQCCGHHARHG